MAEAGWYPDPQDARALQYYDGQRWTGDRRPATITATPTPETPTPETPTPEPPAAQPPATQPPIAEATPAPAAPAQPAAYQPTQSLPSVPPAAQWSPPAPAQPSTAAAASAAPQSWQPPQPPGPPQGPVPPQWGSPPPSGPTPPRNRKKLLIGAGVVVVLVAAGLGGWKLFSSDDKPKLTYQGKQIADPDKVLQTAESTVTAAVTEHHGAKNDDSRCYFTQLKKTPSGERKSDVDSSLLCGPVLFVDGDDSKPYVTVPFESAVSGNTATLTPSSSVDDTKNVAAPEDSKLVRPDGKSAPDGAGGLKVPQPPAAEKDALVTAPLGETSPPPSLTGARMVGKNESVTVSAAGIVPRYGTGDEARSAPDGQELLAFRFATDDGDIGSPPASGGLTISIAGGPARKVPVPSDPANYVVLALPKSGTASLVLDDGGYKQTLSLPDGKGGAGNILVLARQHRFVTVAKTASVPIHLSNGSNSANVTFTTTVSSAALDFWVPRHIDQHPTSTKNALLSVDLDYKDSSNAGTFGWDPQLLKLRLPNGALVSARNIAAAGHIFNVFEVPAGFTTGTLEITGTERVQGITLTVSRAAKFTITIPAG